MAKLLVYSVSATHEASRFERAATLASQVIENVRANPRAAEHYSSAIGSATNPHGCGDGVPTCTPQQQAEDDLARWRERLAAPETGLPDGDGSVDVVIVDGVTTVTVTVNWDEKGEAGAYEIVSWQ